MQCFKKKLLSLSLPLLVTVHGFFVFRDKSGGGVMVLRFSSVSLDSEKKCIAYIRAFAWLANVFFLAPPSLTEMCSAGKVEMILP